MGRGAVLAAQALLALAVGGIALHSRKTENVLDVLTLPGFAEVPRAAVLVIGAVAVEEADDAGLQIEIAEGQVGVGARKASVQTNAIVARFDTRAEFAVVAVGVIGAVETQFVELIAGLAGAGIGPL